MPGAKNDQVARGARWRRGEQRDGERGGNRREAPVQQRESCVRDVEGGDVRSAPGGCRVACARRSKVTTRDMVERRCRGGGKLSVDARHSSTRAVLLGEYILRGRYD